jgi:hypothetical protein
VIRKKSCRSHCNRGKAISPLKRYFGVAGNFNSIHGYLQHNSRMKKPCQDIQNKFRNHNHETTGRLSEAMGKHFESWHSGLTPGHNYFQIIFLFFLKLNLDISKYTRVNFIGFWSIFGNICQS